MRERDREEERAREKEICRVDTAVHYNTSHIQEYTAKQYTNTLQHIADTPIHCNTLHIQQYTATQYSNALQHIAHTAIHRNTIQQCTATQDVVSRAVAVHYRVLKRSGVCCRVLQCAAVCRSVPQRAALCLSVLECAGVWCWSVLQHAAEYFSMFQYDSSCALRCSVCMSS